MSDTHRLARLVFRSSIGFVGATYLGYPLVAIARSRLAPRPVATGAPSGSVSVIVAAHDEVDVIASKLRSVMAFVPDGIDLEVVVADDGSADGTGDAAARLDGVRVLTLPRGGKAAALEAAVEATTGDIVVFTDANSLFGSGTLHALLEPFADPSVGGVAGDQHYEGDGASIGERAHWRFDTALKQAESVAGSVVSATGALYAIRREHFHGVAEGVTDDFWVSTGVVVDGKRLVLAPGAVVLESAASGVRDEYSRKVRIMTRGLRGVWMRRQLLAPSRGFYAVSLAARKVARRLTSVAIVTTVAASLAAPRRSLPTKAVALGSSAIVALGLVGWSAPQRWSRSPLFSIPAFCCMSVVAALQALWNAVTGVRIVRWDTDR